MWIILALGSAVFAGLTAILAKRGIRDVDSNLATALRTVVVLLFSWLMVFIVGSQDTLTSIPGRSLLFLVLSGLATGASWLCYYYAIQAGQVSVVVQVDKLSLLVSVAFASAVFGERLSRRATVGLALVVMGTALVAACR